MHFQPHGWPANLALSFHQSCSRKLLWALSLIAQWVRTACGPVGPHEGWKRCILIIRARGNVTQTSPQHANGTASRHARKRPPQHVISHAVETCRCFYKGIEGGALLATAQEVQPDCISLFSPVSGRLPCKGCWLQLQVTLLEMLKKCNSCRDFQKVM